MHTLTLWDGPRSVVTLCATNDKRLAIELAQNLHYGGWSTSVETDPPGCDEHAHVERADEPRGSVETYTLFIWNQGAEEGTTSVLACTTDLALARELDDCLCLLSSGSIGINPPGKPHNPEGAPWLRRARLGVE